MARLNQLEALLFLVEEHPVFASLTTGSGERRLPVPNKKAIVNRDNGRVLGVVSQGYRLVSNREALDMARECCRTVFPETKPGEWEVQGADAPGTAGHCFIDLYHNSTSLDFALVQAKDRPDAFGPFIRVTNSYNGVRALAFDIGFFRKVCRNGMILPESVIRFKFNHLHNEIGKTIQFHIAHDKLAAMKAGLGEYLGVLRECSVESRQFLPLVCAVLSLRKPKRAKPDSREAADWDALQKHLAAMRDRYSGELGENAYAALNVITEFASHPPPNRCLHRERHGMQQRAGAWLNDFRQVCAVPDFDLGEYINKLHGNGSNGSKPSTTPHGRGT